MEFVTKEPWSVAEQKLAEEFGLKIITATGSLSEFLREELSFTDFDEREIPAPHRLQICREVLYPCHRYHTTP